MLLRSAIVATVAVIASFQTARAADSWFLFSDPNGAFTVQVPGTPTVSHDDSNKTPDGKVVPTIEYIVDNGTIAVIVSDSDFSRTQADPGKVIDGGVDAIRSKAKTIIADQISTLDGQVGHEIVFNDSDANRLDDRIYFAGGHMYQAMFVTTKDATTDQLADGNRFLASFHFTVK